MARINYDDQAAAAFRAVREVPRDGLVEWREAIRRHISPSPGMTLADIGAGTGAFAAAFGDWFGLRVLAVEPSAAMRVQIPRRPDIRVFEGHASALPLPDNSADAAWLSTVIHHLPDLPAAVRELRRVLRPGAPVLIRSAFAGRYQGIGLCRYWPEAIAVLDTYPSVAEVRATFAAAGFTYVALEPVRQMTAPSLAAVAAHVRREAHTPLMLISDRAYEAGLRRLRSAMTAEQGPVIDTLDLLALRAPRVPSR